MRLLRVGLVQKPRDRLWSDAEHQLLSNGFAS